MSFRGSSFAPEAFDSGSLKKTLPRNLTSPFQKAFVAEAWTPPDQESEAWPPPTLEVEFHRPESNFEAQFAGEDDSGFTSPEHGSDKESFALSDQAFGATGLADEAEGGESAANEWGDNEWSARQSEASEFRDGEWGDSAFGDRQSESSEHEHSGRCSHCGLSAAHEAPEFEHAVQPLSSATRDYSLKDIADNDALPENVRNAILTNGEVDVYDLANRAFKVKHPEITGPLDKTGARHAKLRLEYGVMAKEVRALIWLRQVIDELDKTRGSLPREFLLGWMAVESDGHVGVVTSRPERGYFQIDWLAGEAREQLGLTATQFKKLSTNRVFSIEKGIVLAEKYRQWVLTNYSGVNDGTEILWRLTKCRHAASGALKSALDSLVKKKSAIAWSTVSPVVPGYMRKNVDATWDYTTKLKPFADRVGATPTTGTQTTVTPELFAEHETSDSEAFELLLEAGENEGMHGENVDDSETGESEWLTAEDEMESESELEDMPLPPGLAHATLPLRGEAWAPAEEFQTAAPKALVELTHMHVPKTVSTTAGTFSVGSLAQLKTDDLNPLFVDASDNLITDTSSTGLQTCLKALMTSKYGDLLGSKTQTAPSAKDRVRVAIVDLTGDKLTKPDLAGWGSTVPIYGASVPKILALYGAFQLRSDLRELITRSSPTNGAQLEKEAIKQWKSKGAKAPFPDLNWLFDAGKWTSSTTLDFSTAAKTAIAGIMHNCPAGTLIAKVSFQFIGSLTWQSGLFHGTRSGLWLKSAYCGKGSWASPVKAPYSANATALSGASYFTLLAQGRLVDDAASKDIATALAGGCITSLFPSLPVVASKCGLWGGYVHDTAWVEGNGVRYALAVMSKLETRRHSTLYTQLCTDLDQLIRNNNKSPKVPC